MTHLKTIYENGTNCETDHQTGSGSVDKTQNRRSDRLCTCSSIIDYKPHFMISTVHLQWLIRLYA
jgi:hypothetical protein